SVACSLFQRSRRHGAPHASPTRRSSDLWNYGRIGIRQAIEDQQFRACELRRGEEKDWRVALHQWSRNLQPLDKADRGIQSYLRRIELSSCKSSNRFRRSYSILIRQWLRENARQQVGGCEFFES